MDANIVGLEACCIAARQLFNPPRYSSSGHANALLEHIHTHVLRSLLGLESVARANSQNPLIMLPDHALHQILLEIDLRGRCALASACKHLRDRCDALNVIRPIIRLRSNDYWDAQRPLPSILERAVTVARQTRPKDLESVELTWWPTLSAGLSRFLAENMARMQSLTIYFPIAVAQHSHCTFALFELLATPPPAALTDLHLFVDARLRTGPFTFDAAVDPLAGQHLSALRRLRVSGIRLTPLPGVVFADLRQFSWFHGAPATLDRDALASLVACMPRLESLRMRAGWVSWAPDAALVRSSLRHVHVDECSEIANLPGFLAGTQIELLTLTRPSPKTSDTELLDTLAQASAAVSYGFLFCEFIVRPPSGPLPADFPGQQVVRYVTPITPFNVARRSFISSFRHMTSLTLLELFWPRAQKSATGSAYASGPAIALPALTRLCVSLAPCRSRRYLDNAAVGGVLLGLDDTALAPLQTPALRDLEVSYYLLPGSKCVEPFAGSSTLAVRGCYCCRTLSVCLCDIHRFVASCIRLPKGRRLEQLRVNGVEVVDPNPFLFMGLLEQLATVVSVSSVPHPNSCDLGACFWEVNDEYLRLDDTLSY